jgi:hypothetical protein
VTSRFESSANQKPRGDAELSVASDRLQFNADLALRAPDGATLVVPKLSSTVAFGDRFGLETQVHLEDWNTRGESGANVDTRLRYQSPAPFLDELEGRVWRSPDGQSGQTVGFGFHRRFAPHDPRPIALSGKLSVENTIAPIEAVPAVGSVAPEPSEAGLAAVDGMTAARAETRRVRLETEVRGLLQPTRGRAALNIKVDQATGALRATTSSIAYRYSRMLGGAELGFNIKVRHTSDTSASTLEPSVGIHWQRQL